MDERKTSRSRRRASRILAEKRRKGPPVSCDDESPTRERAKPPRRKKKEPLYEEDIVEGFAILSYIKYEDIEADQKLNNKSSLKRSSTQAKLSNFFTKSIKLDGENSRLESSGNREKHETEKVNPLPHQATTSSEIVGPEPTRGAVYDIGDYIGKSTDDFTKEQLLLNHWKPSKDYVFPCVVVKKSGKDSFRRPSHDIFNQFQWLVFSESQNGLFCVYCALFATTTAGGVPLKNLVSKPVTDYKHLLGKDGYLTTHKQNAYHCNAMEKGKEFLKRISNPTLQVGNQVSKQHAKDVEENREKLKSILKCIVFLGLQNIPFRGHRDDGDLRSNENDKDNVNNDGNFRELIRFRVEAGDKVLAQHIESAPGNARYTSKTIQNELIACCTEEIIETIIRRAHQSKWFSIVFDETTDVSSMSQLTFAIRYVNNCDIFEDFVEFVNPRKESVSGDCAIIADKPLTGEVIGTLVLNFMEKHGLPKMNCVGVATDGCSTMVSETKGAVATILKGCSNAIQCICFNHALNLSISKTSNVIHVKRCLGVIKSIVAFFNASSKRNTVLKDTLGRQLIGVCETRWIERHESLFLFQKELNGISTALLKISEWDETDAAATAHSLNLSIVDSSFILSLMCLTNIMSITLPLSRMCQKKTIDISSAKSAVKETIELLEEKRATSEEVFNNLFSEAEELATNLNTSLTIPRVASKQSKRDNYATNSPVDYYRCAIFNPILDHILSDVKERFASDKSFVTHNLSLLIPSDNRALKNPNMTCNLVQTMLTDIATDFAFVIESKQILQGEFEHWTRKWKTARERQQELPDTAIEALKECDKDVYPNINALLQILCTLPVSVATAERSFSTLRQVKDWMRSTMAETRLNGLALMYVHRNIVKSLDYNKIIDRFAKNKRRLDIAL